MFNEIKRFLVELFSSRKTLFTLAKHDFQQSYMGSYLGFVWVFLQPLLFISVMYVVFTFGFRSRPDTGAPFGLYLVCGIIPWLFFASNFAANTDAINKNSFLITKVNMRLSILPLIGILSSMLPHLFFISVAIILAWASGFSPTIYTFQILYYLSSLAILLIGLGWLTSSTNVFVSDVSKLVAVLVQFGFWLTPIFWNLDMFPERYQWLLKLNPLYYIVTGYRDSILTQIWFWERPWETLYFWTTAGTLLPFGAIVFKRLRPHFAEVI